MAAISPTVFKAAIKRALAEGEAKGRRLERRALKRRLKRLGILSVFIMDTARSKRSRRKPVLTPCISCKSKQVLYRKDFPDTDLRAYGLVHAKGCSFESKRGKASARTNAWRKTVKRSKPKGRMSR
jgi:hypothetical protein